MMCVPPTFLPHGSLLLGAGPRLVLPWLLLPCQPLRLVAVMNHRGWNGVQQFSIMLFSRYRWIFFAMPLAYLI
jgi:hypothetical protein